MRIEIAEHAGACYGVNRALKLTLGALEKGVPVRTLGPLIHNPVVVAELAAKGIEKADTLDQFAAGDCVVIRSHGVAPEVSEEAQGRGLVIVDATCPHVKKAQNAAAAFHDQGRLVIVVGEQGHPEVEAICAHAAGEALVVQSPDELPDELTRPIGLLAQTTQTEDAFVTVRDEVARRCADLEVCKTICSATEHRQAAARDLAKRADCMLVIGGRNSGNTTRLFQICSGLCGNSHHIEGPDEIDPSWFEGCELLGITAGASTPSEHIDAVVRAVKGMCDLA